MGLHIQNVICQVSLNNGSHEFISTAITAILLQMIIGLTRVSGSQIYFSSNRLSDSKSLTTS